MSEEKKGIEFGKEWIGELPLQKLMREDTERLRGELHPEDGYTPKGETIEIPTVKYVYSEEIGVDHAKPGAEKTVYFPSKGLVKNAEVKPMPESVPPWEEIPKEAASDDMSDEGVLHIGTPEIVTLVDSNLAESPRALRWEDLPMDAPLWFPPDENDTIQVGEGVQAFCEQLLSETGVVHQLVKVTPQPTSQAELDQGYSWKLKMEIDPKEDKVVQAENVGDGWGAELPPEQQTPEVQTGIPEDKLREVTVPFPADKIREYFQDKSLFFIANYSESKLKGQAFLTYLSNINIPSDVKFNTPMSYEEYAEVMKAYMESINVISCAGLHVMAAEMLLVAKGMPYERSPYALPIDEKVVLMFIEEYRDMVQKWLHFIDSTQVFALRSIATLNDHYKPEEVFPVVEDRSYVGSNIAQLFRIPEFIAVYFSIPNATYELSYFRDQFEEYMFRNETLAKYFSSQNNFAALYFMHYATGLFKAEDINHGLFKIGVFDKAGPYYVDRPYEASIQV